MRFQRDWAGEYGLTPARLDMLIAIAWHRRGMSQRDLILTLDVVPPVVTRMLKALAKLGLVRRGVHPTDRRMRWVRVTKLCRQVLRAIYADLFYFGLTEVWVRSLVAPHARDSKTTDRAMVRIRKLLRKQRRYLTDISTLRYPAYLANGSRSARYPPPPDPPRA
jgi:DNA-binding MarR family transcriptional regulator